MSRKSTQLGQTANSDPYGKAAFAKVISDAVTAQGLTQMQAGTKLGLVQGDVSKLKHGKNLERFSLERLYEMTRKMGHDICISLPPSRTETGKVCVSE
jgi:predicted XRE-type DNA-binding protein